MERNLKAIGLAIVAALALSAFMASAASANYTSNSKTTYTHSTSTNHVFTTSVGSVKCHTTTSSHSISNGNVAPYTVSARTVVATAKECTAFGFPANVNNNGCTYEYQNPVSMKASTKIVCPAGKQIEVVAFGFCTMTIGAQSPGGTIAFANEGSGNTSTVNSTTAITGIVYGGTCGSGNTATLNGTATIKGYTTEAMTTQTGISVM